MDGRDESAPTPTECMLRIIHVHQRLHPHAPTVGIRFIVPAYYGMYAADNRVQPMFIHVHPL